jgi:beta-galactosidase
MPIPFRSPLFSLVFVMTGLGSSAAPLTVTVQTPSAPSAEGFKMGTAAAPDGSTLTLDNRSLLLNGRRWTPVMGEFHYSRYAAAEWREELRKMKAGGIDILATYVFWNHHEELEGQWDWSGDRDLRRFITIAGEAGLKVIVRCGPWCHGEVRNGGVPDWAIAKGWKVRTDDPPYLEHVKGIYGQIAAQTAGLLWKEGGPIIGIQLENEYGGPAEHLLNLKQIARTAGLDVPLYTRTGWPELKTPMPFGEIAPLHGVYAEGFWDRETTAMPGNYWAGFHFSTLRTDANIANEALGRRDAQDAPDVARYPYLTCEIGGGMMSSYHRRILVDPRDIEATVLVKIGSGSVSPGYYMYHGGTNPAGRTTLMEEQATAITNWNDMPVKNYDFQAPLGQYGQVRSHYRTVRRLHHFLHDFGAALADMAVFLPDQRAARSDGRAGFVFVNNYERLKPLAAKEGVQFAVKLAAGGSVVFPATPVTVPADTCFIWPFNLDLGRGVMLEWATAQPLAVAEADGVRTVYFAETPGVAPVFAFAGEPPQQLASGRERFKAVTGPGGAVRVVVLNAVAFEPSVPAAAPRPVATELVRAAGPARPIALGKISQPVAVAPGDEDFKSAAVWRIKLPAGLDPATSDLMLRLHYTGDVARFSIGGTFITDDYYNGLPLEIGLRRHAAALKDRELTVAILPLRQDAITGTKPLIYLSPNAARPDFGGQVSVARLDRVELVPREGATP